MQLKQFEVTVKDGRIPEWAAKGLEHLLARMEGKKLLLTISEPKKRRSGNQNSYYWSVVIPMVTQMFREAGNMVDGEDVHDYLKMRVGKLAQVMVTPSGEVVKSLGSTTKLSTAEFENYLTAIRAWAAEYGCNIPLPLKVSAKGINQRNEYG